MTTTGAGLGWEWQQLCVEARTVYPPWCYLCRAPIDLNLLARHPWSWSLDHLDARSVHGTATPTIDRVRPAHLRCNSSRGARQPRPSPRSRAW